MSTAPALMTMEQYLKTSFHPDVHFVDGEIEERNLGERDHGRIQALIVAWFLSQEVRFGTFAVVEQRIQVTASRVRICDVALLHASAPYEAVVKTPPFICIEVLSPEDRLSKAELVLADYLAMGVEHNWLVDPIRQIAYRYTNTGLQIAANNVLRVAGTDIELEMNALFATFG